MKFIRIIAALLFTCNVANAQFSPGFPSSGSAGVSSISTACGATSTGGPSTGPVTVSSLETPSTVTSGNYSTSNCGNVVYYNSASDQTPTIPLAATAGAGAAFKTCSVQHSQTVTASGSDNIGATGAATTISLPTGTATAPSCIEFTSDGTSRWTPLVYGGSGGTPGGSNTQIQYNNSGAFGGASAITTNGTVLTDTQTIGATSTDGYVLTNTTSAATGAQQWSPRIRLTGQGWQTGSGSSSEPVDWIVENQPVQRSGAFTSPTGVLVFSAQRNGGGYLSSVVFASNNSGGGVGADLAIQLAGQDAGIGYELGNIYLATSGGNSSFVALNAGGIGIFPTSAGAVTTPNTILTAPATAVLQFGAQDVASGAVAQTLKVQSNTGASTTGPDWTLIGSGGTTAGGNIILQTKATTTAATVATLKPTGIVQFNNATYASCTALTTDASGNIACTASAMRFKIPLGLVKSASLDDLHPSQWTYKDTTRFGGGEHVGLYADDVVKMDPLCAVYDPDGQLKNYEDRCVIAHLVAAVKDLQARVQ